eukprot:m.185437 g.185437  ORF g.185437 m.185437 type:complete len:308 (+) comp15028_c0_seq1:7349-8272(+)
MMSPSPLGPSTAPSFFRVTSSSGLVNGVVSGSTAARAAIHPTPGGCRPGGPAGVDSTLTPVPDRSGEFLSPGVGVRSTDPDRRKIEPTDIRALIRAETFGEGLDGAGGAEACRWGGARLGMGMVLAKGSSASLALGMSRVVRGGTGLDRLTAPRVGGSTASSSSGSFTPSPTSIVCARIIGDSGSRGSSGVSSVVDSSARVSREAPPTGSGVAAASEVSATLGAAGPAPSSPGGSPFPGTSGCTLCLGILVRNREVTPSTIGVGLTGGWVRPGDQPVARPTRRLPGRNPPERPRKRFPCRVKLTRTF